MTLQKLLDEVRGLADAVDEGLDGTKEQLVKISKDSDPSGYTHLTNQEAFLASIKSSLARVEERVQALISNPQGEHKDPGEQAAPEWLTKEFECFRTLVDCFAATPSSGTANNQRREHEKSNQQ